LIVRICANIPPVPGPLLCADAPWLLYRAFFALPDSITDDQDRPVNALLGSVNALLQAAELYEPRAVVVCFGAESAEYRTEAYPPYHADRPPMPDALAGQWTRAPELYEGFGWTVLDTAEYEADDVMGTLAAREAERGGRALILTGDRDMFQTATDRVSVLMQERGKPQPSEIGPDGVRERYGIEPEQVPDFIALRGDPSDGLPGAKGIGAKTAADLLRRHGTLEAAIAGAIRERPAVRSALIEQADQLRMFRDVATLRPVEVPDIPDRQTDRAGGADAAEKASLRRLAARLRG
jgi:DNA polymerase-1